VKSSLNTEIKPINLEASLNQIVTNNNDSRNSVIERISLGQIQDKDQLINENNSRSEKLNSKLAISSSSTNIRNKKLE